jgi:phosphoglycolate phosphatase
MTIRGIIFDLDGTLIDTLEDIADAENRTLAELGLPPLAVDKFRWIVGGGADNIARKLLPSDLQAEQDINSFVERFRFYYQQNWHSKTKPYADIPELLKILRQKKIPMAVLSNKPEEFALNIVQFFFPESTIFTHVYGQKQGVPTKPNPVMALQIAEAWMLKPEQVGFLGDSDVDIMTAHNAGMISIGAEWGFRGKEELVLSGAQILLKQPLDLLNYLN